VLSDKLTQLQYTVLKTLASINPHWTLTGGGALAAVYTKHRGTRDLDLFVRGEEALGEIPKQAERMLKSAGFSVLHVQTEPMFCRLKISRDGDSVLLDLVAESVPSIEPPFIWDLQGVAVQVDSVREILANKLCCLLGRQEFRDLVDIRALLQAGGDLKRALLDAPKKDAGFSPLTLAWLLEQLPIETLARGVGANNEEAAELSRFRDELIQKITETAAP